jgi:hypothetical protein
MHTLPPTLSPRGQRDATPSPRDGDAKVRLLTV